MTPADTTPYPSKPSTGDRFMRLYEYDGTEWRPLAAPPATGVEIDLPQTFPLDLDAFLVGLDSQWHTPESRGAWVRLFFRDMQRAAHPPATSAPPATVWPDADDVTAQQQMSRALGEVFAYPFIGIHELLDSREASKALLAALHPQTDAAQAGEGEE